MSSYGATVRWKRRAEDAFAEGRYPVPDPLELGEVVELAPVLETAWALVAQPLTAAFAYGTLAAWNARDDLGRRLS